MSGLMDAVPVRGHHLTSRQRARGLRLFALICILMMPLQFKGGAAETHPHAFFQFWSDAEAAPHHHGDRNESVDAEHDHAPHAHDGGRGVIPSQWAADRTGDDASPSATVAPPGMIGIGQVAGFALAFALATIVLASGRIRDWHRADEPLNGQVVTPPVPPPRTTRVRYGGTAL